MRCKYFEYIERNKPVIYNKIVVKTKRHENISRIPYYILFYMYEMKDGIPRPHFNSYIHLYETVFK